MLLCVVCDGGDVGCRMYPSLSSQVISFFVCKKVEGVNYLVVDFSVVCGSDRWTRYLPLAVVGIAVYPLGMHLRVRTSPPSHAVT
jgi:hypothetical protein